MKLATRLLGIRISSNHEPGCQRPVRVWLLKPCMIRRSRLQRTRLNDCGVLNLIEIYSLFTPNLGGKTVNQYFFILLINSSRAILNHITFLDELSLFCKWLSYMKSSTKHSQFFNDCVMARLSQVHREIKLH